MSDTISELLKIKPYSMSTIEKKPKFLECMLESIKFHYTNCSEYRNFCTKKNFLPEKFNDISEIPFLPINLFKTMTLLSVPEKSITRVVKSSSTTGNIPSQIPLDQITIHRQMIALNSIIHDLLGNEKLDFILVDNKETLKTDNQNLSSRGSAIRGMLTFAKSFACILDEDLKFDSKLLTEINNLNNSKKCIFGFTWLLYKIISENQDNDFLKTILSNSSDSVLLHIGGWKKLTELSIDKKEFNEKLSSFFSIPQKNIIDLYGMTEQLGIVYPDCEYGYKHVPIFSEVIIRDPFNFEIKEDGKSGFIQVLSPIPNSYPGISLLTDDIGEVVGRDNCLCGRKGTYFIFKKRSDMADPKGCGDTIDI